MRAVIRHRPPTTPTTMPMIAPTLSGREPLPPSPPSFVPGTSMELDGQPVGVQVVESSEK